jgi:hypothetical protein
MATTEETQASNRLSDRLRNGLALAQTRIHTMEERAKSQWTDLPAQLRTALDRAFARIRTTLDLPSRADVSDLMERIEALDRKIGALEKRQGKRGAGASAAAATESIADAEIEAAESTETVAAATQANTDATTGATTGDETSASASTEDTSKDTSRKTLQASKGTSANKTLKASEATTRPAKNGESKSKPGKQRSKHQGGKGGKG